MQSEHHRQEEEDKEKQVSPAVGQQGPSQHSSSCTSGVNLKFSLIVEAEIYPSLVYNWCQSQRKRELKVVSRCSPEPFSVSSPHPTPLLLITNSSWSKNYPVPSTVS